MTTYCNSAQSEMLTFTEWAYTVMFCCFLFPFSLDFGGDGLSANYLYVLFPIVVALCSGKLLLPSVNIKYAIFIYLVIFLAAVLYQYSYAQFLDRRIISFILFMSIFSYTFTEVNSQMIRAFKLALVIIGMYFSLKSAILFFSLGGNELGMAAKGAVGGQRFGFIYILGIFLCFLDKSTQVVYKFAKAIAFVILLIGLLLTFSRSGIIAILVTFFLYFFVITFSSKSSTKGQKILKLLSAFFIGGLITMVLGSYFSSAFDFFSDRLFSVGDNVWKIDISKLNLGDSEDSRVYIFLEIADYVFRNPLTGSGYLGVWVMFDSLSGSAHNQYTDVLFRTGIFGVIVYFNLLFNIFKYLYRYEPALFWGWIRGLDIRSFS